MACTCEDLCNCSCYETELPSGIAGPPGAGDKGDPGVGYTIKGFYATDTPADITSTTQVFADSSIFNGTIVKPASVYDDESAYAAASGKWVCPATGRYDLSFYVHYTKNSSPNGFYDSVGTPGMFIAGIMRFDQSAIRVASSATINMPQKHIEITGSMFGVQLTIGEELGLFVTNATGIDYTAVAGDVIRWSARRYVTT